jgi:hypothetical protein
MRSRNSSVCRNKRPQRGKALDSLTKYGIAFLVLMGCVQTVEQRATAMQSVTQSAAPATDVFLKVPIESLFVAADDYGALITVESLSIKSNATRVAFRADNIYPKNWWHSRECINIAPGESIRFTYDFEPLDTGVRNIKLHRSNVVFAIRILDNKPLARARGTNSIQQPNLADYRDGAGLRIRPLSGWRFVDGVTMNVNKIVINRQNTTVTFQAQATRDSVICPPAPVEALWELAAQRNYITDGTGDHYELVNDLTSYPNSALGGKSCRHLAEGEATKIVYVYRRLEKSVNRIEIHIETHDDLAIFPVDIIDTFPAMQSDAKIDLQPLSCSTETTLKSTSSNMKTSIRFMNRGTGAQYIYWLDSRGSRSFFKALKSGESYIQQTFVGHIWLVTSDYSQACLQIFRAEPQAARAILGDHSRIPVGAEPGREVAENTQKETVTSHTQQDVRILVDKAITDQNVKPASALNEIRGCGMYAVEQEQPPPFKISSGGIIAFMMRPGTELVSGIVNLNDGRAYALKEVVIDNYAWVNSNPIVYKEGGRNLNGSVSWTIKTDFTQRTCITSIIVEPKHRHKAPHKWHLPLP